MTTTKATTAVRRTGVVLYDDTGRCRTHVVRTTDPDVARGRALRKWFGPRARWHQLRPVDPIYAFRGLEEGQYGQGPRPLGEGANGQYGEVIRVNKGANHAAWATALTCRIWIDTFPLLPDGTIPSATTTEEETES